MRSRRILAVAACAMLVPGGALACPACFSGSSERVLETYYLTAVAMTVLPMLIVGVFAVWLHRRSRHGPAPEP